MRAARAVSARWALTVLLLLFLLGAAAGRPGSPPHRSPPPAITARKTSLFDLLFSKLHPPSPPPPSPPPPSPHQPPPSPPLPVYGTSFFYTPTIAAANKCLNQAFSHCQPADSAICSFPSGSLQPTCDLVADFCTLVTTPQGACVNGSNPYLFTQTFTDVQLHPKVHSPLPIGEWIEGNPTYNVVVATTMQTFWTAPPGSPLPDLTSAVQTYDGLFPGATFEAQFGTPVVVNWINQLEDADLFRVDPFISDAYAATMADATLNNPFLDGYDIGADTLGLPLPGTTQSRHVTHLHGGHVPSSVDGEPESWFDNTVTYPNIPAPGAAGSTFCSTAYKYPNTRYPGVSWYHQHVAATTRLGTFAGLAGFYLLRQAPSIAAPLDALFQGVYDFPLLLQDRTFGTQPNYLNASVTDSCLCYSVPPQQNDLRYGVWQPEWGGRVAVVNGKVWPVMTVAPRPYRFRFLNGASARSWAVQMRFVDPRDLATVPPGGPGTRGGNFTAAFAAACQAAIPSFYQLGTGNALFVASRDVVPKGVIVAPAERPEFVIDFGDSPTGCVYELFNNGAPFPYQGFRLEGAYNVLTDANPLTHIIRFVVGAPAPGHHFQELPWSGARGSSVAGNGKLRRAVVDAALRLQSAADVNNTAGMSLPPEYMLPDDMDSQLYPVANPSMEIPAVASDHMGPAPGEFQIAMATLDALPPCPTTPAQASQPQAPGSCLRRLALVEHQACPACWPTTGGGNTCNTASPFYAANYDPAVSRPVLGPLATFTGLVSTLSQNTSAQFLSGCANATNGIGTVPYRVLTGPAAIVNGRIARQPHGYGDAQYEYIALSNVTASGRKLQGEYWDIHNFTPDMHPMHLHLVEFRIVARYVVGTVDLDGSGFIDHDNEVADGDCTNNAYWEYPEVAETFAAKDIAKVYPMASNNNSPLPFGQEFRPLCAPKTRLYAIFEDYAGSFVWHCHIIEHEDMDMMSRMTTCLPGDATCSNVQTQCRVPTDAVTYATATGYTPPPPPPPAR